MAGRAISPLLKMKGDDAIAMACAAFCIPTSMTSVRLIASLNLPIRDMHELHTIAITISIAADSPKDAKFSAISFLYCRKNTAARVIKAGKAILPNTFLTLTAGSGQKCLNKLPAKRGTKSNTIFCISSFPTGSSMLTPEMSETAAVTNSIITGSVNKVIMLLNAVRVTDKATSPFASMEKTFEELPPGQQATSTSPMKYIGGSSRNHATENAMTGRTMS